MPPLNRIYALTSERAIRQTKQNNNNNNKDNSRDSNSASKPDPNDWEVRWSPVFDPIHPTSKVRKLYRVLDDI